NSAEQPSAATLDFVYLINSTIRAKRLLCEQKNHDTNWSQKFRAFTLHLGANFLFRLAPYGCVERTCCVLIPGGDAFECPLVLFLDTHSTALTRAHVSDKFGIDVLLFLVVLSGLGVTALLAILFVR